MLLLPLLIFGLLIEEAIEMMAVVAEPLADDLPIDSVGGLAVANLLAVVLVVALCFLLGLIARSRTVTRLTQRLETSVLNRVPGYVLLKGLTSRFTPEATAGLAPVIVSTGDSSRIGLEVDRLADGRRVVYLPGAPNPWSGIVQIMMPDRVEPLDVPVSSVFDHAERMGHGASRLLDPAGDRSRQ